MDKVFNLLKSRTVLTVLLIVVASFVPDVQDTLISVFPEQLENESVLITVLGALTVYFRANPKAKL